MNSSFFSPAYAASCAVCLVPVIFELTHSYTWIKHRTISWSMTIYTVDCIPYDFCTLSAACIGCRKGSRSGRESRPK
jgi:hypothetical protein